jgi:hypothetical protein
MVWKSCFFRKTCRLCELWNHPQGAVCDLTVVYMPMAYTLFRLSPTEKDNDALNLLSRMFGSSKARSKVSLACIVPCPNYGTGRQASSLIKVKRLRKFLPLATLFHPPDVHSADGMLTWQHEAHKRAISAKVSPAKAAAMKKLAAKSPNYSQHRGRKVPPNDGGIPPIPPPPHIMGALPGQGCLPTRLLVNEPSAPCTCPRASLSAPSSSCSRCSRAHGLFFRFRAAGGCTRKPITLNPKP